MLTAFASGRSGRLTCARSCCSRWRSSPVSGSAPTCRRRACRPPTSTAASTRSATVRPAISTRWSTCSAAARCCSCRSSRSASCRTSPRASSCSCSSVVIPRLEQLKKEGQSGQAKLTQYTRYLTIGLAILQSHRHRRAGPQPASCSTGCNAADPLHATRHLHASSTMVITMTAGTAVIMWLGELITDRGVGNGMSLLIFTSIAARHPGRGRQDPADHAAASSSRWSACSASRSSRPSCSSSRPSAASRCSTPSGWSAGGCTAAPRPTSR